MLSKAFDMSSSTTTENFFSSIAFKSSSVTWSKAVSVECNLRLPLCVFENFSLLVPVGDESRFRRRSFFSFLGLGLPYLVMPY